MLAIVSKLTKTKPMMVVVAGILILFAFERVQAASTGTVPRSQFFVHWSAMQKILPQAHSGKTQELEYIMPPMTLLQEKMAPLFLMNSTGEDEMTPATNRPESAGSIPMPTSFFDCFEAANYFGLVLRASDNLANKRESMEQWKAAMMKYHEAVRDVDWNESKRAMTMLAEYELFSTAHELASMQQKQNRQGRFRVPQNV